MAMIGSREFYCIHPERESWKSKDEECLKLVNDLDPNVVCPMYRKYPQLSLPERFRTELWDIEDLVKAGQEMGGKLLLIHSMSLLRFKSTS